MAAHAYCRLRIGVLVFGDVPAMATTSYPTLICFFVDDRCGPTSLVMSVREGKNDIYVEKRHVKDKHTSNNIVNCSKLSDGLIVCGSSDGITRVAIKLTDNPYFLSLNMRR